MQILSILKTLLLFTVATLPLGSALLRGDSKRDIKIIRQLMGGMGTPPPPSETTISNMYPNNGASITTPSTTLYADVVDPAAGIKKVTFNVVSPDGLINAYRPGRVLAGSLYEWPMLDLQEGTYSWTVTADNFNQQRTTSDSITFTVSGKPEDDRSSEK
jgi:hypothetical protein